MILRSKFVLSSAVLALALVACDNGVTVNDDAGISDAGSTADTGLRVDAGPPDSAIAGDPFDANQVATADLYEELCACYFADYGFADAASCVTNRVGTDEAQACDRTGYEAATAGLRAYYTCLALGARETAACLDAAACDPTDVSMCGADDCADPSAAAGQAYADAYQACAEETIIGAAGTCPEGEVSMAVGPAALTGTTLLAGADSAGAGDCGGAEAPDRALRWAAPMAGTYTFDTQGSGYDTLIYARTTCADTTDLDCNDDIDTEGANYFSSITLTLTAGQEIVLIVDGYATSAGDFVVNIEMAPASDGGVPTGDAGVIVPDGGTLDMDGGVDLDGGVPDVDAYLELPDATIVIPEIDAGLPVK